VGYRTLILFRVSRSWTSNRWGQESLVSLESRYPALRINGRLGEPMSLLNLANSK
jgi:hypothetical protein